MTEFPRSLLEFQPRFPDEDAYASYLVTLRWPVCSVWPACGGSRGWTLATKVPIHECADCRKQTSVTAGTVMQDSKPASTAWFWAACLMATHSNGISALQLHKQLGLGSCNTAWLLATSPCRAMVAPERTPPAGLVRMDESLISCRSGDDSPSGSGRRSHQGKLLVASAVEVGEGGPGWIRLAQIENSSADNLHAFLDTTGATARTDGWAGYPGASGVTHDPHVVGNMAAHVPLPWVHRVFANLKTGVLGVYHGLRRQHLQSYLDEFVFRFNWRRTHHAAFRPILGIGVAIQPAIYKMLIVPELQGQAFGA